MHEPDTSRSHDRLSVSAGIQAAAVLLIILLLGVRAASELAMMWESGSDPQMPIWIMFMMVKLILWSLGGGLVALLLLSVTKNRWWSMPGIILLFLWVIAISAASLEFVKGWRALADASDPSTSADRLRELVNFDGLQAGYELDNRLASHPKIAPESLRTLYERDQLGTQMCLASNPNTPIDILQKLAKHNDAMVHRSLARNPDLPESIRCEVIDNR